MSKRILVFDDDRDVLSIMVFILEEKGWKVLTAGNCNGAVALITEFQPSVIIMDNNIPDLGGVQCTRSIKQQKHLQHIPVIFCTGSDDGEKLAAQAGADAFLAKPFSMVKLNEIITKVSL